MKLRQYQEEAVSSVEPWLCNNNGNFLIVLPTGTGKSFVIAELIRRFCAQYTNMRIIVATHVADLVQQDYKEFVGLVPLANCGIYSAGLKERNTHAQVLFVGIQSVYNKAFKLQGCDILLIDEAHTIPRRSDSMWGQFIGDMLKINPDMRVGGLTATEYRLDSGLLTKGEGALFHGVAYEYPLLRAVEEGYLAEIRTKDTETKLSVEGVHKRGGDYIESELQAAVDKDEITAKIVADIISKAGNRSTWMIFGTGVKHCQHIRDQFRASGVDCEMVVGDTPQSERESIYARLKNKTLRACVSAKVMTTGTNIPCIDLIADLAPTESGGLLVQKAGRGMRPIYAPNMPLDTAEERIAAMKAGPKPDCLYLDYANNLSRHGPLDMIKGKTPGAGDGVPPMKVCPECAEVMHAAIMTCKACGHIFPPKPLEEKLSDKPALAKALSNQKIIHEFEVDSVRYGLHQKPGKTPTLRVDYYCGYDKFSEWICLEHPKDNFAYKKAYAWWRSRTQDPIPQTVAEAISDTVLLGGARFAPVDFLEKPTRIWAYQEDKYWRIEKYSFEDIDSIKMPESHGLSGAGNQSEQQLDDDIPF